MHRPALLAVLLLGASRAPVAAQASTDTTPAPPRIVDEGIVPKAIQVPGTGIVLSFGGYAKVDVIQDFDPLGNRFEFKLNTLPVDGSDNAQGGQTTIHAKESRVNFAARSGEGANHLHVFLEGDFFGDNGAFRLRHAYGEFGHLLGGQTWSTFMDLSVRPATLDFEGPEGEVFIRQAMVRWTQPLGARWKAAIAVENPNAVFTVPSGLTGTVRATMPDIPGFLRYETKRWHAQVAGIVRQVRFDGGEGESDASSLGWGVSATARTRTFGNDALMGQAAYGRGIATYIDAFAGQKLDGVLTSAGELSTVRVRGGLIAYHRQWSAKVRTMLAYSRAEVSDEDGLAAGDLRRIQDARVNVVWSPFKLVAYGAEVLWGRRDNQDGGHGEAWRAQVSLTYHLN